MRPTPWVQPSLDEPSVCASVATRADLAAVAAAPLVPPLAWAPAPEDLDPAGELAGVAVAPEPGLDEASAVLELSLWWGGTLREVLHLDRRRPLTVGEAPRADVVIAGDELPEGRFPLLEHVDGGWVLRCPPRLRGQLCAHGVERPLVEAEGWADPEREGCRQVPLALGTQARVEVGELSLQLRYVPRAVALPRDLLGQINYGWLNLLLVSLFAHAGFMAFAALYPHDTSALEENLFTQPNRFAQFVLQAPTPQPSPLLSRLLQAGPGASAARTTGDEGEAGRPGHPRTGLRGATAAARPTDEQTVRGVLRDLFGAPGGGMGVGSVLGGELGGELVAAIGAVHGARVGDSGGLAGLGTRGHGPGGGGTSTTTFGVGRIGTRGHGDGQLDYGASSGGLRPRDQRDIEVAQGPQVLSGALDKELIRQVIADHIGQIRYCYTRELAANPGLHGKVVLRFIIGNDGRVTRVDIAESTLDSAAAEGCLARRVQGWLFPRPRGGGIVVVSYPFLFKQSG